MTKSELFKAELKKLLEQHNIDLSLQCFNSEAVLAFHIKDENGKHIQTDCEIGCIYETGCTADELILNDKL